MPPADPAPPLEPDAAPGRLLALAVLAGLALEVGVRGGPANAAVVAAHLLAVLALVTGGRLRQVASRRLALASVVPAAFLAIRASPWLVASNLAAALGLLTMAIVFDRAGSRTDTGPLEVLTRTASAAATAWRAPMLLRPLVPTIDEGVGDRARRIAGATAISVPVVVALVVLLSSADAVFAGLISPNLALGPVVGHVGLALVASTVVLALVGAAGTETSSRRVRGGFGALEVITMLGLAATVLGLFVIAQLVALTGPGKELVEASGMTPADYARSGFFQLCWATAIVLGFLALVEAIAEPGLRANRSVRVLGAAVPVLALGLVAVSLRRMALYDQAFGLTMLRLWVVGAAVWFGVILVLVAARNLGLGDGRRWVLAGASTTAALFVVGANLADPEAFVVRRNVERAQAGVELDGAYLRTLSDDAVPAIVAARRTTDDPAVRAELDRAGGCTDGRRGAAALNLAAQRAERVAGPCSP